MNLQSELVFIAISSKVLARNFASCSIDLLILFPSCKAKLNQKVSFKE